MREQNKIFSKLKNNGAPHPRWYFVRAFYYKYIRATRRKISLNWFTNCKYTKLPIVEKIFPLKNSPFGNDHVIFEAGFFSRPPFASDNIGKVHWLGKKSWISFFLINTRKIISTICQILRIDYRYIPIPPLYFSKSDIYPSLSIPTPIKFINSTTYILVCIHIRLGKNNVYIVYTAIRSMYIYS